MLPRAKADLTTLCLGERLVLLIRGDFVLRPVGSEAVPVTLPVTSKHHFRPMFTGHLSPCHHLSPPGYPLL